MKPITTCIVAGLQYLIHPQKLGSIQETINPDAIIPVTLLTTDEIFNDLEGVLQLLDSYDDVFSPDFGGVLVEKPENGNQSDVNSLVETLARQIYHVDQFTASGDDFAQLPSGPYFLHGPFLHQAWRLYDDDLGAFNFGVIPDDLSKPDEFQPLNSLTSSGAFKSIPVPSRLYYPRPSPRKPLSGVRVSVSDPVSIKGTHTTLSSRAWQSLFGEASDTTAQYVQELVNLGAVIIGKTKISPFATGIDWVDEQAPWNTRGDGYQRPATGSVGAASGMMGYEWIDFGVGDQDARSHTEASLYSLSPSSDFGSSDGILRFSRFSNLRLFSRSLEDLCDTTRTLTPRQDHSVSRPRRILMPIDLIPEDEIQKDVLGSFATALEEILKTPTERLNISEIWSEKPPNVSEKIEFSEFMKRTPFNAWCYEYNHTFDGFRARYQRRFGKKPFVEAMPSIFWAKCQAITKSQHQQDLERLDIFREWFHENIMSASSTPNAEPGTIMILPCGGSSEIEYRDEPASCVDGVCNSTVRILADGQISPPTISEGIEVDFIASILGAPHLTVPFTQVQYKSRISGRNEYKPICVSVMGARGSDVSVIETVTRAMEKAHVWTRVITGRFTFPVNDETSVFSNEPHGQIPLPNQL